MTEAKFLEYSLEYFPSIKSYWTMSGNITYLPYGGVRQPLKFGFMNVPEDKSKLKYYAGGKFRGHYGYHRNYHRKESSSGWLLSVHMETRVLHLCRFVAGSCRNVSVF